VRRPMLARLGERGRKEHEINFEGLNKDSKMRRNKIMLEEVVRKRENDEFLDKCSAELFKTKKS